MSSCPTASASVGRTTRLSCDDLFRDEAMRLEERILAIGQATSVIADRLNSLGYLFETPSAVFPGPEPDTDAAIARIEHEVGPLPLCLMLFWRLIGNVNFMGQHPQWRGCDYPDALVVFPTSTALSELDDFSRRSGRATSLRLPIRQYQSLQTTNTRRMSAARPLTQSTFPRLPTILS